MQSSDNVIFDAAQSILDCVIEALDASVNQTPRRAYISIGEPAWDDCCDGAGGGQLVVWWANVYPSRAFPDADVGPVNCHAPFTAVQFNVEIVRCAPSSDENGEPPSVAALMASAEETMADARAVWRGIVCCLRTHDIDDNWASIIESQVPTGPEGGCVGSLTTFTVGLIDGCGCS
jgi:hypothetical protein